MTAAISQIR